MEFFDIFERKLRVIVFRKQLVNKTVNIIIKKKKITLIFSDTLQKS